MKVAIFGCLHGMLDDMYDEVREYEDTRAEKIDFVLVCGDCQTIRHADDLICLNVPPKYRKLGDFHDYYSGIKKIPKLTIFVGGNHEASNYLMTLPYGGWVCENFYYLGYAGVIRFKGLRIAGVSGIYNFHNCKKGRFERLPLNENSIRSAYHTRQLDIFRLQLLSKNAEEKDPIDVFISHDWPARIYEYGNKEQLLRYKPAFRADTERRDGLGSPLTQPLVKQLKPRRWFAAHLHCRFYAKVEHDKASGRSTEFLSLDKIENKRRCSKNNPRKNYMEVLDIETNRDPEDVLDDNLYYDEEWLTILQKTIDLEDNSSGEVFCPKLESDSKAFMANEKEIQETINLMNTSGGFQIMKNFTMVEPVIYNRPDNIQTSLDRNREKNYPNPQTENLCARLKLYPTEKKPSSSSYQNDQVDDDVKPKFKDESHNKSPIELDDEGCLPFVIDKRRKVE